MQYIAICCSLLHCVAVPRIYMRSDPIMCSSVEQCVAVRCSALQYVAICCSVVSCAAVCSQCVAMCCSVLQCVAVCCSMLQCIAVPRVYMRSDSSMCSSALQFVAVRCSALQCVAVRCNLLQFIAVSWSVLQYREYTCVQTPRYRPCFPAVICSMCCSVCCSNLSHNSFICVTRLLHMCDMTQSLGWHDSFLQVT